MAVSRGGNEWSEALCCGLCGWEFGSERVPLSLLCGHTYCESCVAALRSRACPADQVGVSGRLVPNVALQWIAVRGGSGSGESGEAEALVARARVPLEGEEAVRCRAVLREVVLLAGELERVRSEKAGAVWSGRVSRPMQRKLLALFAAQLGEPEGRTRAVKAARAAGERSLTELLLLHQNSSHLSSNLWSAVRSRGCQFLGPAMQEEVLRLILLTLSEGAKISRKTLVMYIVQTLEKDYPQASKTSVGHVVQLLYRASCFNVEKREGESSLMQLKEEHRSYEALRREHDAQIVQIAIESGLRISPDQWSSLLYGDQSHRSDMQSIIDKLQTPASFAQSIQELVVAIQRAPASASLAELIPHYEVLAAVDPALSIPPGWESLVAVVTACRHVVLTQAAFCHCRPAPARFSTPRPHRFPPRPNWHLNQPRFPPPQPPPHPFPYHQSPPPHFARPPPPMHWQPPQPRSPAFFSQPSPSIRALTPSTPRPLSQPPPHMLFTQPPPPTPSPSTQPQPPAQFLLLSQQAPSAQPQQQALAPTPPAVGVVPTMVAQTVLSYQPILLQPQPHLHPASMPTMLPATAHHAPAILSHHPPPPESPDERKLRQLSNKREEIVRRLNELDPMDKEAAFLSFSVASSVLNDWGAEEECEPCSSGPDYWATLASSLSSIWLSDDSSSNSITLQASSFSTSSTSVAPHPTTVVATPAAGTFSVKDTLGQPVPTPAVQVSHAPIANFGTLDPGVLASYLPASIKGPATSLSTGPDLGARIDRILEVREALGETSQASSAIEKEHLKWELHIVNKQLQATLHDRELRRENLLSELENVDISIARLQ